MKIVSDYISRDFPIIERSPISHLLRCDAFQRKSKKVFIHVYLKKTVLGHPRAKVCLWP